MRREDPFSTQTMTRSKACLLGIEGEAEGEGTKREDTAVKVILMKRLITLLLVLALGIATCLTSSTSLGS